MKFLIYSLVALLVSLSAWSQTQFSIMTYNVENLFDDQDDTGVDDETYLPLSQKQSATHKKKCERAKNGKFKNECLKLDWNQTVIHKKMQNLSTQILSVDKGKGPDILILVEVENRNILHQFNDGYLSLAKYKTIELIEGEDTRGIDVAVLSRFARAETAKLLALDIFDSRSNRRMKTRGALRVPLTLPDGGTLSIYAVHLPSQGSPTSARIQGLQNIAAFLKKESHPWIVGGDFNITQKEDQQMSLVEKYMLDIGDVSHVLGCKLCKGTHNYKGSWSFLDMLFFDRLLSAHGIHVIKDSIDVIKTSSARGRTDKPKRFIPDKGQGASDHFPLYARLKVEKKVK